MTCPRRRTGPTAPMPTMRTWPAVEPGVKKSTLERFGGRLLVGSGRARGKIFIIISAYLPGRPNTKSELREVISRTLAEFDLNAQING